MANAISSVELVLALGKEGLLASYGAGGMSPARVEEAIQRIKSGLPNGPYLFNLINSPNEITTEQRSAGLYLQYGIRVIEASAYLALTSALVWYRVARTFTNPQRADCDWQPGHCQSVAQRGCQAFS